MTWFPCKDRILLLHSICVGTVILGLRMRPFLLKWGYGFICHHKCPLFRTQPHSFLLLQQCPNNRALLPPVSQNLILLFVPSSQSAVRVCLTNSPLPLSLLFHPFHLTASLQPLKAWQRICTETERRIYFPSL